MGALDKRVEYLEKVVDKLIPNNMSKDKGNQKTSASGGDTPTPPPVDTPVKATPASDTSIRLVHPAYDVPYQGHLVRVTAELLKTDAVMLEHMKKYHPTCFVQS